MRQNLRKFGGWYALLVVLIGCAVAAGDRVIQCQSNGCDIVFRTKVNGSQVEIGRLSSPVGIEGRSVSRIGARANPQEPISDTYLSSTASNNACWNLAGNANDSCGAGINLTVTDVDFDGAGFYGRTNVARFNKSTSRLSVNNAHFHNLDSVDWGIMGWFYVEHKVTTTQGFFTSDNSAGTDRVFQVLLDAQREISFRASTNGTSWTSDFETDYAPIDEWVHIAVTYQTSGIFRGYINGREVVEENVGTLNSSNPPLDIGHLQGGTSSPLNGRIQDVAFVRGDLLTIDQISAAHALRYTNSQQIAAGHNLTDDSFPFADWNDKGAFWVGYDLTDGSSGTSCGGGTAPCNLTNVNSTNFTSLGIFGATPTLTATDDDHHLKSEDPFFLRGNADFSAGAWFALADWRPEGATDSVWLMTQNQNGTNRSWDFLANGPIPAIQFRTTSSVTTSDDSFNHQHAFTPGSWHHIAVTFHSRSLEWNFYVDGERVGTHNDGDVPKLTAGPAFAIFNFDLATTNNGCPGGNSCSFANGFYVTSTLSDQDIKKLFAAKINHSKNILPSRQNWTAIWQQEQYNPFTLPLENGWLVNMEANDLFVNFSSLDSGAKITIK